MSTTITIPALRAALRKLEANVTAEELWEALRSKSVALAHYKTQGAIARAMTVEPAEFIGPMREAVVEDADFSVTGSFASQPIGRNLLQPHWTHRDCGSLDAPQYIPTGSLRAATPHRSWVRIQTTDGRDLMVMRMEQRP